MFLAPFFFIVMTSLMTNEAGRHAVVHPAPVRVEQLRGGLPSGPVLPVHVEHAADRGPVDGRDRRCPASPSPTPSARMRWKGRQVAFLLVLSTLMLPVPGDDRPALRPVGARGPDRPPDAADPAELPRRRVLDLPAAAVLHDDPRGAVRRRSRRRRERVPDHDAGDRAAGQARDRRRGAVQLPLQLERPVLAAALRGEQPEALDADARPHGVPAAARHASGTSPWRRRS